MVPPYGSMQGGSTATIEYAMAVLKVPHIIVCGHTDCGVMKALLHPEDVHDLPAVREWVGRPKPPAAYAGSTIPISKAMIG